MNGIANTMSLSSYFPQTSFYFVSHKKSCELDENSDLCPQRLISSANKITNLTQQIKKHEESNFGLFNVEY